MRDQIKVHASDAGGAKASLATKPKRAAFRQHRDDAALMSSLNSSTAGRSSAKKVLVVDVGGSSVKILASEQQERRSFRSGPTLTPAQMVSGVKDLAADWTYDVVSIGIPGPVLGGRPIGEPRNLGPGWVGFDFGRAFGRPVKVVNDAAMQALGSYRGGKMLFLGLGTGLGTAMIVDGIVAPMEVGHLPYKKATYEHYVGRARLKDRGKKKWRLHVIDVVKRLIDALQPDDTVVGGGNVAKLKALPPRCRAGRNANAFRGGFRLWAEDNVVASNLRRGRVDEGPRRQRILQSFARSEIAPKRTARGAPGPRRDDSTPSSRSSVRATPLTSNRKRKHRTKRKQSSAGTGARYES
jgi:polyphosphate glucokinase